MLGMVQSKAFRVTCKFNYHYRPHAVSVMLKLTPVLNSPATATVIILTLDELFAEHLVGLLYEETPSQALAK